MYLVIAPQKLTESAFKPDNPVGAGKVLMFQCHLGFTRDNCQALVERISPQTLEAEGILGLTEIRKDI